MEDQADWEVSGQGSLTALDWQVERCGGSHRLRPIEKYGSVTEPQSI